VTKAQDDIRTRAATESATATSSVATGGGYSANALKYGLSVAIRLDALWPRAIEGFMRDPLLGSGYSTLTKSTVDEFTQAESTDNDYLRMLGETGLLGTLSFLGILGYLAYIGYRHTGDKNDLVTRLVSFGIIGSIVGLLVNAATIDVFESSKVAYSLWILSAVAIWLIEYQDKKSHVEKV
jgi:O-antigen ligase